MHQAEIFSILIADQEVIHTNDQQDSQKTIQIISGHKYEKSVELQCRNMNTISESTVHTIWVFSQSGISGNEKTYGLYKEEAVMKPINGLLF